MSHLLQVVPRDSSWFSEWDGAEIVPLRSQRLYVEDWIGLRALDEQGRLLFEDCPGGHMDFSLDWFSAHVINPYLMDESLDAPEAQRRQRAVGEAGSGNAGGGRSAIA